MTRTTCDVCGTDLTCRGFFVEETKALGFALPADKGGVFTNVIVSRRDLCRACVRPEVRIHPDAVDP